MRIAGTDWPVVLPTWRDARLHTAAVIMTVHVLGQVALGFAVSVPQIASAIGAAALTEVAITAVRRRALVWPASAMLTGSGVGLILRVAGTEAGDHWSWRSWWLFAAVAAGSVLTKYVIRWRGAHVFNPSNLGLVVTFVALGADRVEPLPFHWGDTSAALLIAALVIVGGGAVVTRRLRLLALSAACLGTLAAGLGLLVVSGHCMLVPGQTRPVCDGRFWWTVMASPELAVFLLFMVTDPRTVPARRGERVLFGAMVGALATVLIAPQRTEFGAKVGLLGALTLVCALRPLLTASRSRTAPVWRRLSADQRGGVVGVAAMVAVAGLAATTVALGAGARSVVAAPVAAERLPSLAGIVAWSPPAALPAITADPAIVTLGEEHLDPAFQRRAVLGLLHALAVEAEVLRRREASLLPAVDHGARLLQMQQAVVDGDVPKSYAVEAVHLVVTPGGGHQSGPVLGAEVRGTEVVAGRLQPWSALVGLRRASDDRWLIVAVTAR